MDDIENKSEQNILYEILTFAEWNQNSDLGLQKIAISGSSQKTSYFNPWKLFSKAKLDNKKFLQTEYAWQLAVSHDGKVVAILQESLLEIRTAKDEYSSIIGKAQIPCDQCPQLRKLAWSPDNTFLAVARDNGIVNIYNILGCIIATIQPDLYTNAGSGGVNNVFKPVVGLCFLQSKFKSTKWSNELLVIYESGEVRSILLSSLDGCDSEENIKYSLESHFPQGITAVAYHSTHHIILVAGPCLPEEHGISVWRVLNDYPYIKPVSGFEKKNSNSRSFFRFLPGYTTQLSSETIIKMRISPNGEMVACLHYGGDITFWYLPSVKMKQRWPLQQQPHYDKTNPQNTDNDKEQSELFHPVDICWWSDSALVVARNSGAISVCSINTSNNLLGESPEFLESSPQISSIHGTRSAVIALECEVGNNLSSRIKEDIEDAENDRETSVLHASIQAALYSFTDMERFEPKKKTPRIVQRTYRLLALKRTTPEELYARKIDFEDYDSALSLAQTYNLDCDLVYQKQWRSSTVNKESIYNYLDKIKNIFWVLNECVERVPDTIDAAKELLEFGLRKTELDEDSKSDLDSTQRKIISFRRQILSYSDNLSIYQKIIGDVASYNPSKYDQFRRKSALVNSVEFARDENWLAVSIMFTFRGNEILEYRLPILSNFPETLPPRQYRSLLPEVIENKVVSWDVQRLRFPDWSEESGFCESSSESDTLADFLFEDDQSMRRFASKSLTPDMVEEWYARRIYEIEKNTGLVENALSFASLGQERNIKSISPLLFNLQTLHCLVYVVQDQEVTLSKLEAMSNLEQLKLLMSKTTKESFIKDLKNIFHPFAMRCEKQGSSNVYSLLTGLLLAFSEENLDLALQLFSCLREDNGPPFSLSMVHTITLALDCLYACQKADQSENGYSILECLPVRGTNMTAEEEALHDRLDKLEKHLEICDILEQYHASRPLSFVLENEDSTDVGKELMQEMARYTRDETLNFTGLLDDLQRLQTDLFTNLDPNYCFELVAYTQMTCECEEIILSAEDLLQRSKDEHGKSIPLNRSIDLVLDAAKVHFERATNYDDFCIKLSQTCLNLINEPHPQICEELDLIESLLLLQDFNVRMLPLQIRKCKDKIKLIEECLEADSNAYQSSQRLLQLSHALRIYGEDRKRREGEVLILIARYALKALDYENCSEICDRLVTKNFSPAWPVARDLAENEDYQNNKHKKEFLAFAILHCPPDNLEKLIQSRVELHYMAPGSLCFPKPDSKSSKGI